MLAAIGLDETHEAAYRALVSVGAADVADLARRLTLAEQDTERALRRLERQGLAAQSSARPGRWVAAPPGVALGALLTQQRHELEKAELAAALLAEEYRAAAAEPAVHDLVEVVTGTSAVAQRFLQLQLGAAEEVCALVTGNPVAVSGMENDAEEQAAERRRQLGQPVRQVQHRALHDHPVAHPAPGRLLLGVVLHAGHGHRIAGDQRAHLLGRAQLELQEALGDGRGAGHHL
ncbi:helix-turn-helix domain-containing protein, partial [Streptomyces tricolor]|uniref:helix-turn-helix domain-containing protein n=1 Tax=Streptomyces tricolor TaxID=68277 RepID=UPI001FCA32F7